MDESEETFKCAVLLLAALEVGQSDTALAHYTGYSRGFIIRRKKRLIENGVWKDGITYCDWSDPETGQVSFWLDVGVARGFVNRSGEQTPAEAVP